MKLPKICPALLLMLAYTAFTFICSAACIFAVNLRAAVFKVWYCGTAAVWLVLMLIAFCRIFNLWKLGRRK